MDEKTVKGIIRSILTSNPFEMTLKLLTKDFKDMVGLNLPTFGYNSIEQFLKNCPDICQVVGTGPYANIRPVITEKVAHINGMVQTQKTKAPKSARLNKRPRKTLYKHVQTNIQHDLPKPLENSSTNSGKNYTSIVIPCESRTETEKNIEYVENSLKNIHLNDSTQQQNKKKLEISHEKEDDVSNVPTKIQNNLKTLIKQFPHGLWCAQLPSEYRNVFKKDLSYLEYGYRSLIEMCVSLKHIFYYVRPGKDDFKLYDRNNALLGAGELKCSIASIDSATNKMNALPVNLDWTDFDAGIPSDIVCFGETIKCQFFSPPTKINDVFDVTVVEIFDPCKFWICLKDSALDELMDQMQNFYKRKEVAEQYAIPEALIKEGLYCVQVIFNEYHRALIVKTDREEPGFVRVAYIDYGTICKAPIKGMCFLHKKFSTLSAQAIRCRLANVLPPNQGSPWTIETVKKFRQIISGKQTKIRLSHLDNEQCIVTVYLAVVTEDGSIVYVNEEMVRRGLAIWANETQKMLPILPNYKAPRYVHLIPSFPELEFGDAPSFVEIEYLNDADVPFNQWYPRYFTPKLPLNDEELVHQTEENFIEVVRSQRTQKFTFNCDTNVMHAVETKIDFDLFAEMKEEIFRFYSRSNEEDVLEKLREDCQVTEDLLKKISSYVDCSPIEEVSQVPSSDDVTNNLEKIANLSQLEYNYDERVDSHLQPRHLLEDIQFSDDSSSDDIESVNVANEINCNPTGRTKISFKIRKKIDKTKRQEINNPLDEHIVVTKTNKAQNDNSKSSLIVTENNNKSTEISCTLDEIKCLVSTLNDNNPFKEDLERSIANESKITHSTFESCDTNYKLFGDVLHGAQTERHPSRTVDVQSYCTYSPTPSISPNFPPYNFPCYPDLWGSFHTQGPYVYPQYPNYPHYAYEYLRPPPGFARVANNHLGNYVGPPTPQMWDNVSCLSYSGYKM